MPWASEIIFSKSQVVVTALRKHPLINQYFNENKVKGSNYSHTVCVLSLALSEYNWELRVQEEPEHAEFYIRYSSQKILPHGTLKLARIREHDLYFPFLKWLCFVARTTKSRIRFTYEHERGDATQEYIEWTFDYSEHASIREALYVLHPDCEHSEATIAIMTNGDVFVNEFNVEYDSNRNKFVTERKKKSWNIWGKKTTDVNGQWIQREDINDTISDFLPETTLKKLRGE